MCMALGSLVLHDSPILSFLKLLQSRGNTVKASLYCINQDSANILLVRMILNYMLKQHGFNLQHRRIFTTILFYTDNLAFILTIIWLDTESLCMTINVQFCFST